MYKKISDTEWVITLQEDDETKDLYLEFPPGCLDQVGWDIGDNLIWNELPDGGFSITKKEEE